MLCYINLLCDEVCTHNPAISVYIEGTDFIGPVPSVLTFTSGQSAGDIQCAEVTIVDDDLPEGERNFSISIGSGDGSDGGGGGGDGDGGGGGGGGGGGRGGGGGGRGGGGGGVHVSADFPSISINIALDIDDSKSWISCGMKRL